MQAEGNEEKVLSGFVLIQNERERQMRVENYSLDADWFNYPSRQLEAAAHCYARAAFYEEDHGTPWPVEWLPHGWPWPVEAWKPKGGVVRCLEKAGALYLAQADIDRESKADKERAAMLEAAQAMGNDIDRVRRQQPKCVARMIYDFVTELREESENMRGSGNAEASAAFRVTAEWLLETWRAYQARVQDWQTRQQAGPGDRTGEPGN